MCHVRVWLYEWEIIFVFAHFCTRAHAGVGKCLQYASGACAAKNSLSLTVLYNYYVAGLFIHMKSDLESLETP